MLERGFLTVSEALRVNVLKAQHQSIPAAHIILPVVCLAAHVVDGRPVLDEEQDRRIAVAFRPIRGLHQHQLVAGCTADRHQVALDQLLNEIQVGELLGLQLHHRVHHSLGDEGERVVAGTVGL